MKEGKKPLHFSSTRIRWRQSALVCPASVREKARILAFHGGGGVDGRPEMLVPFCTELAREHPELTIIAAEYRTLNRNRATLKQMLADAGHALNWSRRKAPPESRLFVMGASFGGLLALDAVFAAPDQVSGLILLNPVTDTAKGGFSNRVIPPEGLPDISPMQRWKGWHRMNSLRCLTVHGSDDNVVPIDTSKAFCALWPPDRCSFVGYPNVGHGFFNQPAHSPSVSERIHKFMASDRQSG